MGIAAAFISGVSDMTKVPKLQPPLATTLPNAQAFGQSADTLEKWAAELKQKLDALRKARDEYMAVYRKWEEFNKNFVATGTVLDRGVKKYWDQGREWPQREYMEGCKKMRTGLDVIESKRKQIASYYGPVDLADK